MVVCHGCRCWYFPWMPLHPLDYAMSQHVGFIFQKPCEGPGIDGSVLIAKLTVFFTTEDIFIYLFPKELWEKIIIILNTVSQDDSHRVLL